MNRFPKISYLLLSTFLLVTSANAHESVQFGADVVISEIAAVAGPVGGHTVVEMYIDNDSSESLYLNKAWSEVAENSIIIARLGHMTAINLESIAIPAGESADFASSHLRIELTGLNQPIDPDDVFSVHLEFMRGKITVPVHVHSSIQYHSKSRYIFHKS